MIRSYLFVLSICLLAACGNNGSKGTEALVGTWKADCMQINEGAFKSQLGTMQITQDSVISKVTSFTDNNCSQGSNLYPDETFKYRLEGNTIVQLSNSGVEQGKVTYSIKGNRLTLTAGGSSASFTKQ